MHAPKTEIAEHENDSNLSAENSEQSAVGQTAELSPKETVTDHGKNGIQGDAKPEAARGRRGKHSVAK